MSVRKRIAVALVPLCALAIAAGVGLMSYLSSERFARRQLETLQARLCLILGRDVTIESLKIHPFDRSFEVRGLVARGAEDPPDRPFLRIAVLRGRLNVTRTLFRRLAFHSLEVEGPEVNVTRSGGTWSWIPGKTGEGSVEAARVVVHGGIFRLEDIDTPLEMVIDQVSLDATGSGPRRFEGSVRAERVDLTTRWSGRRTVKLSATFRSEPDKLTFEHLRVEGDWLVVSGGAEITLTAPVRLLTRGSVRVDSKGFVVAGRPDRLSGQIFLEGEATAVHGTWSIKGALRADELSLDDWRIENLRGPLTGNATSGVVFGPASGSFYGGAVEMIARWTADDKGGGRAEFHVRGSDLPAVLVALHRPVPLAGQVEAEGEISWPKLGWSGTKGQVEVKVTSATPRAGARWPVEGRATLALSDGTILVRSLEARSESAAVVAKGTLDMRSERWSLDTTFSSGDLAASSPLVEDCAAAVGLDTSAWRLATVAGAGIVSGHIDRNAGVWTGQGTLAAGRLVYRGVSWGETVGKFNLTRDRLELSGIDARRGQERLTLAASLERKGAGFSLAGEAEPWEVSELLRAADLDLPIGGAVVGDFSVSRQTGRLTAAAHASLGAGLVRGFNVDSASADISVQDDLVHLSPLILRLGDGSMQVEGALAPKRGSAEAAISWRDIALERTGLFTGQRGLAGLSSGKGTLSSRDGTYSFSGEISSPALSTAGYALGPASGTLDTDFREVRIDGNLPTVSSRLRGRVAIGSPNAAEAEVAFERADIKALAALLGKTLPEGVAGEVSGQLDVTGPLQDPSNLRVSGHVDTLSLFVGAASFRLTSPAAMAFEGGRMNVSEALFEGEGSRIAVSGWIRPGEPATMEAHAEGQMDLAAIQVFMPDTSARGSLNLKMEARGALQQPSLSGEITVTGGRLRRFDVPVVVESLSFRTRVAGDVIDLQDFSAIVGGGAVTGDGKVTLQGLRPVGVAAHLRVRSVSLEVPRGFRATYTGDLNLSGTVREPVLSGDLDILRGLYTKNFRLESFSLGGRTREFEPLAQPEETIAGNMRLDLRIHADDNLWLRNDLGQMENRADLAVGGTLARPEVSGRIVAFEGGRITFRRVDYSVREGSVELAEPLGESYLSLSAETRVSGYDILLRIFGPLGPLKQLEYQLSSNPSLPADQIVSLLITGSPSSLAGGTSTPGELARAYLGSTVTGYIEQPLEKILGLDTLRIDPLLLSGESDPTTRVTVGRRVTPDLLLLYSSNVGGEAGQIYGLEYQLNRHLRLYGERGTTGGVGGDVRYFTHFRLPGRRKPPQVERKGPEGEEQVEERQEMPRPVVRRVIIEGEQTPERIDAAGKVPLKRGQVFNRRKMLEGVAAIKRAYLEKGYLEAQVKAGAREVDALMEVTYTVVPGRRIDVLIEGAGREQKRVRERLEDLWQEALFTEDLLEEAEKEIARYFRNQGRYTVLVDRSSEPLPGGGLRVTFHVDPGEVVRVSSVSIEGNKEISAEKIQRQMLTAPDTLFSRRILKPQVLDDDVLAIRRLYVEEGHLHAQVKPRITLEANGEAARVTIQVNEGDRALVGAVSFQGPEGPMDEGLLGEVPLKPAAPYSPFKAYEGEGALKKFYDRLGYPDIRVGSEAIVRGDRVDLIYHIDKGQKQTIRRVEIEGNRLTADKVIQRELKLRAEEPVSHESIREAQQRLYRLGIFEGVDIDAVPAAAGKEGRILRVRVKEADNLSLAVGLGYDSETGPRGTFEIANVNFRGSGRYVGLQTRVSQRDNRVQFLIKEPRLFGRPWDSVLSAFWESQERESFQFDRVGSSIQVRRQISPLVMEYFRTGVNVSNVDPDVPDSVLEALNERMERGRVRLANAGYAIVSDRRDSPFLPRTGTYVSIDARLFAGSQIPSSAQPRESLLFSKLFLQGTYQRPLGRSSIVYATSLRAGIAPRLGGTASVPLVERYFGGGDTTVRGFPRDLLGSSVDRDGTLDEDGNGVFEPKDFDDPSGTLVPVPVIVQVDRDKDGTTETLLRPGSLEPLGGEAILVLNQELRFPIKGTFGGSVFYDAGNVYRRVSDIDSGKLRHVLGLGLRLETPVGPIRLEYGRKLDRQPQEGRGQFFFSIGTAF